MGVPIAQREGVDSSMGIPYKLDGEGATTDGWRGFESPPRFDRRH